MTQDKPLLLQIGSFLKKPTYSEKGMPLSFWKKLLNVFQIFAMEISIGIGLGILVTIMLSLVKYDTNQHAITTLMQDEPIYILIILACIYAPITEEITFRLILKYSPIKFGISMGFIAMFGLQILLGIFPNLAKRILELIPHSYEYSSFIMILLYVFTIITVTLCTWVIAHFFLKKEFMNKVYSRFFPIIFYSACLTFGFIHLFNYNNVWSIFYLIPLLVSPQLIVGLMLGYIRSQYGFFWSVMLHAVHNSVSIIPLALLMLFSPDLIEKYSNTSGSVDPSTLAGNDYIGIVLTLCAIMLIGLIILSLLAYTLVETLKYYIDKKDSK